VWKSEQEEDRTYHEAIYYSPSVMPQPHGMSPRPRQSELYPQSKVNQMEEVDSDVDRSGVDTAEKRYNGGAWGVWRTPCMK